MERREMNRLTSGKWEARDNAIFTPTREEIQQAIEAGETITVRRIALFQPSEYVSESECKANATACAAVKDLLDALKYARRFLKPEYHDTAYIDGVIAKAEGKD